MAAAHRFEELECWQLARQLKIGIYRFASRPQVRADRRFRDQICDAVASISSNIAEGFVRRSNPAFVYYLDIARGSLAECQDRLQDAVLRAYMDEGECGELLILSRRLGGAMGGLQRYLESRINRRGKSSPPAKPRSRPRPKAADANKPGKPGKRKRGGNLEPENPEPEP
jgi:four helix bundle protein